MIGNLMALKLTNVASKKANILIVMQYDVAQKANK
jgi:hypothetical protein